MWQIEIDIVIEIEIQEEFKLKLKVSVKWITIKLLDYIDYIKYIYVSKNEDNLHKVCHEFYCAERYQAETSFPEAR